MGPGSRASVAAFIFLASCGLGEAAPDPTEGTGTPHDWAISVAVDRQNLPMKQGATDTVHFTVTRSGGFIGPVEFKPLETQTPQLTIANVVTTGTTTTALLIIKVPSSYPLITFPFPVLVRSPTDQVAGVNVDMSITVSRAPGVFVSIGNAFTVARGGPALADPFSLIRTDFDGEATMSLALGSAPAGITAVFTPNPLTGTTGSMAIQADASVPEGVYNIGVRANGGGFQGTAPLNLTVTPPPSLALTLASGTITLARGTIGQVEVTLTRTNLPSSVSLVTSNTPFGLAMSFTPPSTTGNTMTANVNITPATVPGNYIITINSNGFGVPAATVPLTVVVTP
ncbi:MAG: hypothetical protein V4558_09130 [Gemmatimonadota bacterium]